MTQLDDDRTTYAPDDLYWNVHLWWREANYASEAGGHFSYEAGDTAMAVIARVAEWRRVPLERVYLVECELGARR